jgi:hypothetical protein
MMECFISWVSLDVKRESKSLDLATIQILWTPELMDYHTVLSNLEAIITGSLVIRGTPRDIALNRLEMPSQWVISALGD